MPTESDDPTAEEVTTMPERIQFPAPEHLLPLSHQPIETGNTMPQSGEVVSTAGTKNPRLARDQADEAMRRILSDRWNAWEGAVGRINQVMDMLGPIAEVRVMPF